MNVSSPGYEGIAETIEVAVGPRDIMVRFREVRLDAKIDVVHRHRIGSCRGTLIASPAGLKYETTDKDDAVNVALLDLDMFQVDYLESGCRFGHERVDASTSPTPTAMPIGSSSFIEMWRRCGNA